MISLKSSGMFIALLLSAGYGFAAEDKSEKLAAYEAERTLLAGSEEGESLQWVAISRENNTINPFGNKDINKDRFAVFKIDAYSVFAVFDGHGGKGDLIAKYLKDELSGKLATSEYRGKSGEEIQWLEDACEKLNEMLKKSFVDSDGKKFRIANYAGSTAIICLIRDDGKVFWCNIGDSGIAKVSEINGKAKITRLSASHDLANADELARVTDTGATIFGNKIEEAGALADFTRALGDFHFTKGIIAAPECAELDFDESDRLIILASDGLWKLYEPEDLYPIIECSLAQNGFDWILNQKNLHNLIRHLQPDWDLLNNYFDDTTVIIIKIPRGEG